MADRKIGIKIADGSFYPILEEGRQQKKRLVLTTVNDDQENVQIDLYRGEDGDIDQAEYIGSLLVEHIKGAARGEPEIEVVIGTDEEGNLETTAEDRASGERQSLSVSLQDLSGGGLYEVPEFSIADEEGREEEPPAEPDLGEEESAEEEFTEEELDISFPEEEEEEPGFDLSGGEEEELPDFGEEEPGEEELPEEEFAEEDIGSSEGFGSEEPEGEEFGTGEDYMSDIEQEEEFPEEESAAGWEDEVIQEDTQREEEQGSRRRPLLVALLVLLTLALLGALLYLFVFTAGSEGPSDLEAQGGESVERESEEPSGGEEQEAAEEPADVSTEENEAQESEPAGEAGESVAQAEEEQQPSGGASAESGGESGAPMQLEKTNGGVWYRIRWGDTLWELSYSFYDTPWLYGEIAEENRISDPDRIFAEDRIFIPEDPEDTQNR